MRIKRVNTVGDILLRDFKQNNNKVGISDLSLLRMFSVYRDSVPKSSTEGSSLVKGGQPSVPGFVK